MKITSVDELVKALENRVERKEAAIDKSKFRTDRKHQRLTLRWVVRRDTEQNAMEGIELSFTKLTLRDPVGRPVVF